MSVGTNWIVRVRGWSGSQRLAAVVSAGLIAGAGALAAAWTDQYGWPWSEPVCSGAPTELATIRGGLADGLTVDGAWKVNTGSGRLIVARAVDSMGEFTAVYLSGSRGELTPLTTTAEYLTPTLPRLASLPDQQSAGFARVQSCVASNEVR